MTATCMQTPCATTSLDNLGIIWPSDTKPTIIFPIINHWRNRRRTSAFPPTTLLHCSSSISNRSLSPLAPPLQKRVAVFPISLCCFSSLATCPGSAAEMDSSAGPSLFPLHRCKTLHLVRHAQGIHNVEGERNYKAYMKPEYFDAHLTPLGWQQVDNLCKHVQEHGLLKRIELVVASPMLRTLQTAVGVFGGGDYTDRRDILPLMVANAGNSGRGAISSFNSPPIVAVELCREHFGVHPCDKRQDISEYQFLFPAVDFSLIETNEDTWWKVNVRETTEELAARGLRFMNWLLTRPEKEIAVVSHSGFLRHALSAFGDDCHPLVKNEIRKRFANCELRSMVIADRSMLGSDSATTNYPGKIPSGPDAPSDAAEEDGNATNSTSL